MNSHVLRMILFAMFGLLQVARAGPAVAPGMLKGSDPSVCLLGAFDATMKSEEGKRKIFARFIKMSPDKFERNIGELGEIEAFDLYRALAFFEVVNEEPELAFIVRQSNRATKDVLLALDKSSSDLDRMMDSVLAYLRTETSPRMRQYLLEERFFGSRLSNGDFGDFVTPLPDISLPKGLRDKKEWFTKYRKRMNALFDAALGVDRGDAVAGPGRPRSLSYSDLFNILGTRRDPGGYIVDIGADDPRLGLLAVGRRQSYLGYGSLPSQVEQGNRIAGGLNTLGTAAFRGGAEIGPGFQVPRAGTYFLHSGAMGQARESILAQIGRYSEVYPATIVVDAGDVALVREIQRLPWIASSQEIRSGTRRNQSWIVFRAKESPHERPASPPKRDTEIDESSLSTLFDLVRVESPAELERRIAATSLDDRVRLTRQAITVLYDQASFSRAFGFDKDAAAQLEPVMEQLRASLIKEEGARKHLRIARLLMEGADASDDYRYDREMETLIEHFTGLRPVGEPNPTVDETLPVPTALGPADWSWGSASQRGFHSNFHDLRAAFKSLGLKPGEKVVDIGSGDGRVAVELGLDGYPGVEYTGFEINHERAEKARQVLSALKVKQAKIVEQDLSAPDFKLPPADDYYLYDPVNPPTRFKLLNELHQIAQTRRIRIVAHEGRGDFLAFLLSVPWLKPVSSPTGSLIIFESVFLPPT